MLQKLINFYAHSIIDDIHEVPKTYHLTVTENKESITLDKRKLSEDEINLLEVLFNKEALLSCFKAKTISEEILYGWLVNHQEAQTSILNNTLSFPTRFIHFSIKGSLGNRVEFEETMKNIYPSTQSYIWTSSTEGVMLQQIDDNVIEDISHEAVADILASDFFVQIYIYIGSLISELNLIKSVFDWEREAFKTSRTVNPSKKTFTEQEVIPDLIVRDLSDPSRKMLMKLLAPVLKDTTLLDSVKVYLECNMNTSLAAKKMYMHRNTLQYRVDKFIEKTSIDIKRFPNAVAVYLLFLINQN